MSKKYAYLIQRRQSWYVQVRVPDSLYPRVGKRNIKRSLETRNKDEAEAKKWPVVGWIKSELQAMRLDPNKPDPFTEAKTSDSPKSHQSALQRAREYLESGPTSEHRETFADYLVDEVTELDQKAQARAGAPDTPENREKRWITEDVAQDYSRAIKTLRGAPVVMVSEALDAHYEEISRYSRKQTARARKRHVEEFVEWLGSDREIHTITKFQAGEYLNKVLLHKKHKIKTTKDIISDLSTFFNWCELRGLVEKNPFYRLGNTIRDTTRGTKEKKEARRRPFTDEELGTLLNAIKDKRGTQDPLWPLTLIGMFTGMRGNEIAEIEIKDVHDTHIHIPEAKTEESVRDIPIHSAIAGLVKSLKESSTDGYLISNLKRGGADNRRYHVIGKRFTTVLRKGAELTDQRIVFHSLRKSFATALENAGVPLSTAEQLEGHKKQSMTYGGYSGGVSLDKLAEEVEKVEYGTEVAELVKSADALDNS